MALQNSPLLFFLVMVTDWIPGLSQIKSIYQVIAGDGGGAIRTQNNFSRQCPGISQLRSTVEFLSCEPKMALETQKAFVRNAADIITLLYPPVAVVKISAEMVFGREGSASQTVLTLIRRFPGTSQVLSLGQAICGDGNGAVATQMEFLRHLGIPVPMIKNFYHYTNKKGVTAIKRYKIIRASSVEARDAAYGRGVYFTSMDPRHFSKTEIRKNNYGNSAVFLDRTDYVVEVWMPWNHIHRTPDTRDIYLYANDVKLKHYYYTILLN